VTRFSQLVLSESRHTELANLACKNAIIERDVAHLIFPDDVQTQPSLSPAGQPAGRMGSAAIQPAPNDITQAVEMINNATRPIIVAGHGAWENRAAVIEFAEQLDAPVLTTFKAKGLIPDSHPLAAGVLGRSGTPIASWFMNESDLIIALGASFSNHTGIDQSKPIIQVDFERMQLGRFHPVSLPIWSELNAFCTAVSPRLNQREAGQSEEVAARWSIWRSEKATRRTEASASGVPAIEVFDTLTKLAPEDSIIAVDVGNNTYSFGRYFETAGQRVLMSGYLGSIGFALPAAMGAWAATQDFRSLNGRKVIAISGDGGLGQYAMELTTAVKYQMDITHILLHNRELGKISKEQRSGEWPVWQTGLHNPSFAAFAKNCGAHARRIGPSDNLTRAIDEAINYAGPALVEIMTDPMQN
jgi:thiamine pyrophosphate-dependent acetolactate synthase large subunit-like protein